MIDNWSSTDFGKLAFSASLLMKTKKRAKPFNDLQCKL